MIAAEVDIAITPPSESDEEKLEVLNVTEAAREAAKRARRRAGKSVQAAADDRVGA